MMACFSRASFLAIASTAVLSFSTVHAQEPPAEVPPAPALPAATEGRAETQPAAPLAPARPSMPAPTAPPNVRRVDASEPRKITGMVLTAIGAGHGFAGSVVLAGMTLGTDGFGALFGLLIGGPLMGEGLILTTVGIPLWVSGARTVEKIDPPFAAWLPSFELGAGTADATWHF